MAAEAACSSGPRWMRYEGVELRLVCQSFLKLTKHQQRQIQAGLFRRPG